MPRSARITIVLVILIQVAWSLPLAMVMGNKWLTTDEPDVSYACDDGGTCYSGEGTWRLMTLLFGGIALIAVTILLLVLTSWARTAARRNRLLSTGMQVPGLLVDIQATGTRINGRPVCRYIFESRVVSPPVRAVHKGMAALAIGAKVTLAYDPADPNDAILVETMDELGALAVAQLHDEQQRTVDAMFAADRGARQPGDLSDDVYLADARLRQMVADGQLTERQYQEQLEQLRRLAELTRPPD
jgi:hypothetical protein